MVDDVTSAGSSAFQAGESPLLRVRPRAAVANGSLTCTTRQTESRNLSPPARLSRGCPFGPFPALPTGCSCHLAARPEQCPFPALPRPACGRREALINGIFMESAINTSPTVCVQKFCPAEGTGLLSAADTWSRAEGGYRVGG